MKRSLAIAAFAGLVAITSFTTGATAQSSLSAEDLAMCRILEQAHETTCEEFESIRRLLKGQAAASLSATSETTGSIAPRRFSSDPENFEPQVFPNLPADVPDLR